jgi:hypothetical protein
VRLGKDVLLQSVVTVSPARSVGIHMFHGKQLKLTRNTFRDDPGCIVDCACLPLFARKEVLVKKCTKGSLNGSWSAHQTALGRFKGLTSEHSCRIFFSTNVMNSGREGLINSL